MNKKTNLVSFWDGEECEYCDGPIVDKQVIVHRTINGVYLIFEDVPAGVCRECGTRYFAANVLKQVEERISGKHKADREVTVPIYSF